MADRIDVGRSYDLICDEWRRFRNSTQINRCVVGFADLLPAGGRVLDVGCGTGYPIADYLTSRSFSVTGIDVSGEMISRAQALRLPGAEFFRQDLLDFSSDLPYDGVIAFDSIWHIEKTRQAEGYRKISSLMKNGGYFLFTHGNREGETVGEMFGQKFYYGATDIATLRAVLAETGLQIVSLTENYKEPTTGERDLLVVARKRI